MLRGDVQFTTEINGSSAQFARERHCLYFASGTGIVVAMIGGLFLLGWAFQMSSLDNLLPDAAPMKPLMAICFALCGSALALQTGRPALLRQALVRRRVARGVAAFAAVISFTSIVEYTLHLNIIGVSLFHQPLLTATLQDSGKNAPGAAISLLLLAVALAVLDGWIPGAAGLSTYLAVPAALLPLAAIIRYLYGVSALYGFLAFPPGALHASLLILLSAATLLSRPSRGLPAVIISNRFGGWIARRLLPVAILGPIAITWIRVAGQRAGFYGPESGLAGVVVANIIIFSVVVWLGARSLNRLDAERRLADEATTRFVQELASTSEQLRASEERFRLFMSHLPAIAFSKDNRGRYVWGNAAWRRQFPAEWGDLTGKTDADLWPADTAATFAASDDRVREEETALLLSETTKGGADMRQQLVSKFPIPAAGGDLLIGGVAFDTTENKRLEIQLYQAQKLEAIGLLAGGVAHDFNNLLTIILGYVDVGRSALGNSNALHRSLDQIEHAAALTKQLLAFGRKQVMQPRMLSLNAELAEMQLMLRRVIREDITLNLSLASDAGVVKTDPVQIQQIVMNLAMNAQDAMIESGSITVETANAQLDESYMHSHPDVQAGAYVMLAVSDTGTGMDTGTLAHIFEPFFTTKAPGKGTGLGLATVYGIVKQNGGHIFVYSVPGQGTSFKIYLPRVEQTDASGTDEVPSCTVARVEKPTETLLIVEDEDALRSLIVKACMDSGYHVLEAHGAEEATDLIQSHPGTIHMLVTDVVMPGISGCTLAKQMAERRPEAKILFCSGYAENAIVHHGVLESDVEFLQKPFTPAGLLQRIHSLLAGS